MEQGVASQQFVPGQHVRQGRIERNEDAHPSKVMLKVDPRFVIHGVFFLT